MLARAARPRVVAALLAAHPYEEPAYDVVELADPGVAETGSGRIGTVAQTTLGEFAQRVADVLPQTAQGVRVAGDPDRAVRRVAVCGGAGDFLLDDVRRSDADVYVTSDLRHHPAARVPRARRPGAGRRRALGRRVDLAAGGGPARGRRRLGDTVETRVSTICTDPWTASHTGEER